MEGEENNYNLVCGVVGKSGKRINIQRLWKLYAIQSYFY
jgi:hypothetical protein